MEKKDLNILLTKTLATYEVKIKKVEYEFDFITADLLLNMCLN